MDLEEKRFCSGNTTDPQVKSAQIAFWPPIIAALIAVAGIFIAHFLGSNKPEKGHSTVIFNTQKVVFDNTGKQSNEESQRKDTNMSQQLTAELDSKKIPEDEESDIDWRTTDAYRRWKKNNTWFSPQALPIRQPQAFDHDTLSVTTEDTLDSLPTGQWIIRKQYVLYVFADRWQVAGHRYHFSENEFLLNKDNVWPQSYESYTDATQYCKSVLNNQGNSFELDIAHVKEIPRLKFNMVVVKKNSKAYIAIEKKFLLRISKDLNLRCFYLREAMWANILEKGTSKRGKGICIDLDSLTL